MPRVDSVGTNTLFYVEMRRNPVFTKTYTANVWLLATGLSMAEPRIRSAYLTHMLLSCRKSSGIF